MNIAICDDNQIHLQLAEGLVNNFFSEDKTDLNIQKYLSSELLLSDLEEKRYVPDIAVLDIEMDGDNGIVLAKKMNREVPRCRIIFLTSYTQYAQDVYEAEHIWFVVKKDAGIYFNPAMEKALESLKAEGDSATPGVLIRKRSTSVFIPLDQILYISRVARKAQIICLSDIYTDTRRPALLLSSKIEPFFIRCHQGYWVNINMIQKLDHDTFILKGGTTVPISRTFRDEARRRFLEHYTR